MSSGLKIITFNRIKRIKKRQNILQVDLAEERVLHLRARDAISALRRKRKMIEHALAHGAEIEPGTRRARIRMQSVLIVE